MTGARPVVVGASVAGAVAALRLAESGVPVRVLERRREPVAKVCGEGLQPAGRAALELVLGSVDDAGTRLCGFTFHPPGAERIVWDFPAGEHALGCDRLELERRLWDALRAHPLVELETGVSVRGLARAGDGWELSVRGGSLRARFVIGADGVGSRVRRWAGLDRGRAHGRWGVRARVGVLEDAARVAVHFRGGAEAYVTPLADGRTSIAVLGDERLCRALRAPRAYADFVAALGLRGDRELVDAPQICPHRGRRAVPARDGVVLAGDAAFFLDPISGAGMTLAVFGGALAARHVLELAQGDPLASRRFGRDLRAVTAPYARLTRFLLLVARSAVARSLAAGVGRRVPAVFDRIARPTLAAHAGARGWLDLVAAPAVARP